MTKNPLYLKWSSFLGGLAFYAPVAPLFFLSQGVSLSLIVLSQAAYSIAILLSEVPTGVFGDKYGHRKSIILGGLCEAAGIGFILLFPNVVGLFGGYILLGIGASFQSGSVEALLYESSKSTGTVSKYKRHLAQILSNDTLAFAIGTAVVGVTYGAFGNQVLTGLIICSLLAKLAGMLATLGLKEVEHSDSRTASDSTMWQTFKSSISHIKSDSTLINLTYVKLLTLTAQYVIISAYQPYFQENNVSPYFIGFVLTMGGLANSLTMRNVHRIEKYLSLDKAVLVLGGLMGLTYLTFSIVNSPWLLVLTFVVLQAQYNLLDPIISDYINDRTASGTRATVLSGISLIRSIANTGSKILLGLAIAGVGVAGMLRIQAAYMIVGTIVSYWLLTKCGCVYRLSSEPSDQTKTLELEAAVENEIKK